ncbi:hypothetical protein HJFPF1_08735 [Paramyrothecium foliicola]|nr:hypothetical protein HJFPF1_08735 [Paramyrothecium foliicola]
MATVTVIYPVGLPFDLDYYLATHMPLVQELWGPQGLKSWEVTQHSDGEYQITAVLRWDSLESFDKAGKDEIFADIPNFTEAKPLLLKGTVQKSVVI